MLLSEKDQDLEKALDALNILKTEIKSKSDQLNAKTDHVTSIDLDLAQTRNKLTSLENEHRIKDDAKNDVERRLLVAMQDRVYGVYYKLECSPILYQ